MRINKLYHQNNTIAWKQISLLILPIVLILGFMPVQVDSTVALLLGLQWWNVLCLGIFASIAIFLAHKYIRFIFSSTILFIFLYLLLAIVPLFQTDLFEGYVWEVRMKVLFAFGIVGWIIGALIGRFKWGIYIVSLLLLALSVNMIYHHPVWFLWQQYPNPVWTVIGMLAPSLLGSVYLIITQHHILAENQVSLVSYKSSFWRKQLVYLGILIGIMAAASTVLYFPVQQTLYSLKVQQSKNENSMLKDGDGLKGRSGDQNVGDTAQASQPKQSSEQDHSGKKTLNDFLQLGNKNNRGKKLLFIAYIDNFFEDGTTPNPLYLAMYYYGKFNTKDETFLVDTVPPGNDLFIPKIDQLALYQTLQDSSKLHDQINHEFTKTVNITVFKKNVDAGLFTAPSVAFSVQPISVEPAYRKEFYAAYEAKSLVSSLNSAYFIYNDDREIVRQFQEQRNIVLRRAGSYASLDTAFYNYYTTFPSGKNFDSIAVLAQQITKDASTTMDKVLAIKDYFWSRDDNGKRIFGYSDNPGIPELPSASRLNYFLFQEKKGYCAYYAGATLYMLRALGIPSRIVGGFLTEDRSKRKNRGWYWFYEDQAHAWVQVYFPGFGWIDFDTTVDNDEAREGEQADGTPPIIPQKPILAIQAEIKAIDSVKGTLNIAFSKLNFKDKAYSLDVVQKTFDLKNALIKSDTALLGWDQVHTGDSIIALSFNQALAAQYADVEALLSSSDIIALNEIHLFPPKSALNNQHNQSDLEASNTFAQILKWIFIILGVLVLIGVLFYPYWRLQYWRFKIRNCSDVRQQYDYMRSIVIWLMQSRGIQVSGKTLLESSKELKDVTGINLDSFVKEYNQLRFSKDALHTSSLTNTLASIKAYIKSLNAKEKLKMFWIF